MEIQIPIHNPGHNHNRTDGIYDFDARGIAKRFRHAAIFGALDALLPGERMRFVNDHNPLPLLQQLQARYGERVSINYLEQNEAQTVIDFVVA
ncbi:MAG: hypothetical protein B7Y41_12460 [Hydrogenophilales bacterium 28-61-23]|nr:MAG: hypothetical protein B7Y41_12460 [Hydrogenophilales bacterium 28-61-23]